LGHFLLSAVAKIEKPELLFFGYWKNFVISTRCIHYVAGLLFVFAYGVTKYGEKRNFFKNQAYLNAHSLKMNRYMALIFCSLKDLHFLNRLQTNERDWSSWFHVKRPQSWDFSKMHQVQGQRSPLVPSGIFPNFCVMTDIYLYFHGLPMKFCYRDV